MNLSDTQLQTLKRTIAKELTDVEFDLFLEACRSYQLDPFRKQIIPSIYNKNDPARRQMTLITTRDGLRVIASRQRDYRPAATPPEFLMHPDTWEHPGSPAPPNPMKIEAVTVTLFKKDGHDWFPVVGQAYWDEYAPTGNAWSKSQWPKMPRVMIAKCAEAAALRAGWPDAFAGLYVAEELMHAESDASPSQLVHRADQAQRQTLIGRGIVFDIDGTKLQRIESGQVFDRLVEALDAMTDTEVLHFRERNEEPLREFWADNPTDALELKRIIEPRTEAALTTPDPKEEEHEKQQQ
jgi:phage recombination protein Bet